MHWYIHTDEKNILWVGMERQNSSVNTIDEQTLRELKNILEEIEKKHYQGIIFYSLKKTGFIVGADIKTFSKYSESDADNFIKLGQTVFEQLATLSIPTVALINGACLGGGLELALACRYIIITDQEKSAVGLPEVSLGIIPAWGGIKRSIQRMGVYRALTRLLLTGKSLKAKEALKLGLVDAVVPVRQLDAAAIYYIQHKPLKRRKKCWSQLENKKIIATILRLFFKKHINPEHYPAPYRLLDILENPEKNTEIDVINTLMAPGGTARELLRLFFLKEKLKHSGLSLKENINIQHVHVVGAGTMGTDIAALCVLHGLKVTLQDIHFSVMGKAFIRAKKYFERYSYGKDHLQSMLDRFTLDFEDKGLEKADIIIEAIVEDLAVKQQFFKTAEQKVNSTALLATNTSSLSVAAIASVLQNPGRLIGLHFFNPATKMPLVEVIYSSEKSKELFSQILAFITQIGKLPIHVSDSPGFLVNRVLMPYLVEGMRLLSEGVAPVYIDEAAQSFGMMMGPIELADTVGLDVCADVAKNLSGEQFVLLEKKIVLGQLGKKTRRGIFRYNAEGKRILSPLSIWMLKVRRQKYVMLNRQKIVDRLIYPMIHEAKCCLNEEVVEDKDLLDAAMIFGAGFAPFRGGPLRYSTQFTQ